MAQVTNAPPPVADPNFLFNQLPSNTEQPSAKAKPEQRTIRPLSEQVWRLPNGYEEFYMLLALQTGDKKWCDRLSLESQIRKVDARPGVQVVRWRDICLIEVAGASSNAEICRFVRGAKVDALDGSEIDDKYCRRWVAGGVNYSNYNTRLHWLTRDPYKPLFLNPQAILQFLGFTENDLVSSEKRGFYNNVSQSTWNDFLFEYLFNPPKRDELWQGRFAQLINRSVYLPDFAANSMPVDRYLRYSGTAVQLPADCYENPAAEFTCRMLECLRVRDITACRTLKNSDEVVQLRDLFIDKCAAKKPDASAARAECEQQINLPYRKIFEGPPETFLPYISRGRN
jgi:hypothetical protein